MTNKIQKRLQELYTSRLQIQAQGFRLLRQLELTNSVIAELEAAAKKEKTEDASSV